MGIIRELRHIETDPTVLNKKIQVFLSYKSTGRGVLRKIKLLSSAGNLQYIQAYALQGLVNIITAHTTEYILLTKIGVITATTALKHNIGGLLLYKISF